MRRRRAICAAVLICIQLIKSFTSGYAKSFESVPDLEKAMYSNIDGYPCVRLLNTSGEIGCSNPGRTLIRAPIVRWEKEETQVSQPSTFLVAEDEMQSFFLRVSSAPSFSKKVAAVLVEHQDTFSSSELSPDRTFPQSEFSPYKDQTYNWNPSGSGIMFNRYDFPVFLLSKNSTFTIHEIDERSTAGAINMAELDMVMQTTKAGTRDSESCLRENSCLPLGGYSVWSSLPPLSDAPVVPSKPLILVMASQNSASFFRDKSVGAEFPLSGMISLLAAVDALSHLNDLDELKKRLVFVIFTGEAWGYLGSRRFLVELDMGLDSVKGLNSALIDQVLEVGSVGKGTREGVTTLFAHTGGATAGSNEILAALNQASTSLGLDKVKVNGTSTTNPGVSPSSFMSFLNKNSSTPGVVLEDFDSAFTNKFFHSHLDNPQNIDSSSVEATANLVARAAYILAYGETQPRPSLVNSIKVNTSLIDELVGCLLSCVPGLSCSLVKNFISPSSVCPSHYVGVFLNTPSESQPVENIDDTTRFIWNFLADKTSKQGTPNSKCQKGRCSAEDQVCVGLEADKTGRCVVSSTRYVAAYSPRLKHEGGKWKLTEVNVADPKGGVDPIWTESFWNTLSVRVYRAETPTYEKLILLAGIALTLVSYLSVVSVRAYLMKALKRD